MLSTTSHGLSLWHILDGAFSISPKGFLLDSVVGASHDNSICLA